MHWIVQDNLFNENRYPELVEVLERLSLPYSIVKVIPFVHELATDVNPEGPVYVCGATALSQVAKKKGWKPGSYLNECFDQTVWSKKYETLNGDARFVEFRDVPKLLASEEIFVRPVDDGKAFAGAVISAESFREWHGKVMRHVKDHDLERFSRQRVSVSRTKAIYKEFRLFVVGDRIVTASLYREGGRVTYRRGLDDHIKAFAEHQIAAWTPCEAFVLDVADTPDGAKVVEINNINSAGFYDIDIQRMVIALEGLNS